MLGIVSHSFFLLKLSLFDTFLVMQPFVMMEMQPVTFDHTPQRLRHDHALVVESEVRKQGSSQKAAEASCHHEKALMEADPKFWNSGPAFLLIISVIPVDQKGVSVSERRWLKFPDPKDPAGGPVHGGEIGPNWLGAL